MNGPEAPRKRKQPEDEQAEADMPEQPGLPASRARSLSNSAEIDPRQRHSRRGRRRRNADRADESLIHIYHATTGLNARGELINPGQQISRLEALRLWTSATPWFFDDEPLGTIEVGNYGDLIVLNKDYFKVPDEGLKRLRSI